jgi:chromosome segregation ATPase
MKKNPSLNSLAETAEKLQGQVTDLETQKGRLTRQNEILAEQGRKARANLRAELEAYKQQLLKDIQAEIAPLTTQRDELRSEVDGLRGEKQTLTGSIEASSTELESVRGQLREAYALLALLHGDSEGLTIAIEADNETLAYVQGEVGKAGGRLQSLTKRIATKTTELSPILDEQRAELGRVTGLITEVQAELDDLNTDLQTRKQNKDGELDSINQQIIDAKERLRELTDKETAIREDIATQRMANEKEREALSRWRTKLEGQQGKITRATNLMKL